MSMGGPTETDIIEYDYETRHKEGRLAHGEPITRAMAREIASLRSENVRLAARMSRFMEDLVKERQRTRQLERAAIEWCPKCSPKEQPK